MFLWIDEASLQWYLIGGIRGRRKKLDQKGGVSSLLKSWGQGLKELTIPNLGVYTRGVGGMAVRVLLGF